MATTSIESSSPSLLHKEAFSPSSEKHFWSTLNNRVNKVIEGKKLSLTNQVNNGALDRAKRIKEDSKLLLRGFDSVSHSLSQLSNNLENALQGARDLSRFPRLTEILHCTLEKCKEEEDLKVNGGKGESGEEGDGEEKRGQKRKIISEESAEDDSLKDNELGGGFNKAKNLVISMATKAGTLARELKSIKSDLCFMQERCTLLEEENRRLRDGYGNDTLPEDDDLMRLQMEALLAEKSRLGNENANLTRENQSLRQLVEYHQLTSQDLSASYENLIRDMGMEFSSPEGNLAQEEEDTISTQVAVETIGVHQSPTKCNDTNC